MKTLESFWRWAINERPDRIGEKQLKTLSPVALQSFTLACQLIDQRAGIPEGAQVDRTPLREQCRDLSLSICAGLVAMHEHIEADSLKPAPKPRPTTTWYRAYNGAQVEESKLAEADRERMRKDVANRLEAALMRPSPVLERIKQENDRLQAAAYADERAARDSAVDVYYCFTCGKGHPHHEPCKVETLSLNTPHPALAELSVARSALRESVSGVLPLHAAARAPCPCNGDGGLGAHVYWCPTLQVQGRLG